MNIPELSDLLGTPVTGGAEIDLSKPGPVRSRVRPPPQVVTAAVTRGVCRWLGDLGFSTLVEFKLGNGRRADVVGLGASGELWIVEIKSSIEDFRVDRKWPDYRCSCDRLFFATHAAVPSGIFPEDTGLIMADAYGAELLREAPEHRLAAATRKAMLVRFAQAAAHRLHGLVDPAAGDPGW